MMPHGLTPEPPILGELIPKPQPFGDLTSPNPLNGLRVGIEDWAHVGLGARA
jgi:hypothetical protein